MHEGLEASDVLAPRRMRITEEHAAIGALSHKRRITLRGLQRQAVFMDSYAVA
jgi:hypothetical protein